MTATTGTNTGSVLISDHTRVYYSVLHCYSWGGPVRIATEHAEVVPT